MFYTDPTFWVLVSFIIFCGVVWWKARGIIAQNLDTRVERIQAELDEVRQLKAQAQQAQAEQRQRNRQAKEEVKAIEAAAREEVTEQARLAHEKLERTMAQRREQATQRIVQAEAAALKEIAERTIGLSISASQKILEGQMVGKVGASIIDAAIKEAADIAEKHAE
ncbi:MAG: F0F1 ATP synthase subunit B [Alphaproteobacteria bacterium]|nr:F0F1 ATP synthase subunit B [Alphaproteobacteria bacterium]